MIEIDNIIYHHVFTISSGTIYYIVYDKNTDECIYFANAIAEYVYNAKGNVHINIEDRHKWYQNSQDNEYLKNIDTKYIKSKNTITAINIGGFIDDYPSKWYNKVVDYHKVKRRLNKIEKLNND